MQPKQIGERMHRSDCIFYCKCSIVGKILINQLAVLDVILRHIQMSNNVCRSHLSRDCEKDPSAQVLSKTEMVLTLTKKKMIALVASER